MLDTLFLKCFISRKFIGIDRFYFGGMLLDKLQQGLTISMFNNIKCSITTTLYTRLLQ